VNDDCDTEAKYFWKDEEFKGMKVASMKLSDELWALWIGDEKIYTQVRAMMYNHIHAHMHLKIDRRTEWMMRSYGERQARQR
jgi:hypothetical protein